jgi:hypothetical protein
MVCIPGVQRVSFRKCLLCLVVKRCLLSRRGGVVLCSNCGYAMDFAGVSGPDEGGGLVYVEGDTDDYANW